MIPINPGRKQPSDFFAAFAHVAEHLLDAHFVYGAHGLGGKPQAHPAIFAFHPKTVFLQVWQKPAFGFVVRV